MLKLNKKDDKVAKPEELCCDNLDPKLAFKKLNNPTRRSY